MCLLYGRGRCLCLEFASADSLGCVWLCARCCNGASCGSGPGLTMSASWSCGCRRVVSTGPAPGAGRGAAAKRCRGVWGAGPLQWGEFERGIPLSCCRPGQALFIPYNSVLYKKERPHRPGTNPGGRSGANRPGFSRFAFCIRSSYTVGAPAAISRRNAPRVIKSARAGNAVDVRRRCDDIGAGGDLRVAVRPGRS